MNNYKILIFALLTIITSCSLKHEKKINYQINDHSDFMKIAIFDFCKNKSKLLKNDNSFHVQYKDLNNNLCRVTIIGNDNKFIVENKDSLKNLPNKFIDCEKKLFFWKDKSSNKNDSIYAKFIEFNLIETNNDVLEEFVDDKKKAAIYFFCKNNINKYKKVTSNTFNHIPKLKCN